MGVDERARHRLYRRLEEVLGPEEAGTLMNHLPPAGLSDLATKADLRVLEGEVAALEDRLTSEIRAQVSELRAQVEQAGRKLVMWTSSTVLAAAALAFAAGRFA
jgi:hypothetical protein